MPPLRTVPEQRDTIEPWKFIKYHINLFCIIILDIRNQCSPWNTVSQLCCINQLTQRHQIIQLIHRSYTTHPAHMSYCLSFPQLLYSAAFLQILYFSAHTRILYYQAFAQMLHYPGVDRMCSIIVRHKYYITQLDHICYFTVGLLRMLY